MTSDSGQTGPQPTQNATCESNAQPKPTVVPPGQAGCGGAGLAWPLHLILATLSAGGMLAAAYLWVAGHGWLGARLLAGDVLLMLALLLLSRA